MNEAELERSKQDHLVEEILKKNKIPVLVQFLVSAFSKIYGKNQGEKVNTQILKDMHRVA